MIRAERFNLITNLSNEKDVITLEELAERLNVSVATVRRDVEELCGQGIVDKTRGGIIVLISILKRKNALRRRPSVMWSPIPITCSTPAPP